jgi:cell division transport system ATP-binding protein
MGQNTKRLRHSQIPKFRRNLGVVFQDFRLLKDRNVYENVAFAQRIIQVPGSQIRKNVPKVLATVGLAGKYKAKPGKLSGGEQQRVAIARALAGNADILLCDEPTGALDFETGRQILVQLQKLCREYHKTVIIVTHTKEISLMADRVISVKDGKIVTTWVNEEPMLANEINW